jgi:hypothetical protein
MWACSKSPPRQSTLTGRGGGSEREVRNELLACFLGLFWRVMWDGPTGHFGGMQPISSFLDVGMLQNPPRLSILTRRGGGSEAGMRNELLACFLGLFWRVMWDSPTSHFGDSPYLDFQMWSFSQTLPVYRYWWGGPTGARQGWETGCLLLFCCLFWKLLHFTFGLVVGQ